MHLVRMSFLFTLICMGWCASAYGDCPSWRPCGSGHTWGGNRCVRQGFYGADFRPACQRHDDCLASGCYCRRDCDRQFLNDMYCACDNCSYDCRKCRCKARCYYCMARIFGGLYH